MSQTPSSNPNQGISQTPLDKIVFALIDKKKQLDQETNELFNKVNAYIEENVNKIKEAGYRVTYWDCQKRGLLFIDCVINVEIDRDLFYAIKSTTLTGKFENYNMKVEVTTSMGREYKLELKIDVEGNASLLDQQDNNDDDEDFDEEDYEDEE